MFAAGIYELDLDRLVVGARASGRRRLRAAEGAPCSPASTARREAGSALTLRGPSSPPAKLLRTAADAGTRAACALGASSEARSPPAAGRARRARADLRATLAAELEELGRLPQPADDLTDADDRRPRQARSTSCCRPGNPDDAAGAASLAPRCATAGLGELLDELAAAGGREATSLRHAPSTPGCTRSSTTSRSRTRSSAAFDAEEHERRDRRASARATAAPRDDRRAGPARRAPSRRASARRAPRPGGARPAPGRLKRAPPAACATSVREPPDVCSALKPCWAMSPLVVSQLLPPTDRTSTSSSSTRPARSRPADAIPAILRGTQLVVAGDEQAAAADRVLRVADSRTDEDDDDEPTAAPARSRHAGSSRSSTRSARSCRPRTLDWHYRSRDERLIAFSNAHIYDRSLTTFPGVGGDDVPASTCSCPLAAGAPRPNESPSRRGRRGRRPDPRARRARGRQSRSASSRWASSTPTASTRRCASALATTRARPNSTSSSTRTSDERFFVKNLERVQGDERDAIILSIGYGKNARRRPALPLRPAPHRGRRAAAERRRSPAPSSG